MRLVVTGENGCSTYHHDPLRVKVDVRERFDKKWSVEVDVTDHDDAGAHHTMAVWATNEEAEADALRLALALSTSSEAARLYAARFDKPRKGGV